MGGATMGGATMGGATIGGATMEGEGSFDILDADRSEADGEAAAFESSFAPLELATAIVDCSLQLLMRSA